MNNIIAFLGILIAVMPFFKSLKNKKTSMESLVLIIAGILLLILSVVKNKQDERKELASNKKDSEKIVKIDSLKNLLYDVQKHYINDSIKKNEFENKLFKEFKIIRDTTYNKPILLNNTYNTSINKAQTVNIGPH